MKIDFENKVIVTFNERGAALMLAALNKLTSNYNNFEEVLDYHPRVATKFKIYELSSEQATSLECFIDALEHVACDPSDDDC